MWFIVASSHFLVVVLLFDTPTSETHHLHRMPRHVTKSHNAEVVTAQDGASGSLFRIPLISANAKLTITNES